MMDNEKCDLLHPNGVKAKKMEVIDGYTIKYHANGTTPWSKGKMINSQPEGYWEWYRPDGTIKRSGYFEKGEPIGDGLPMITKERSIRPPNGQKKNCRSIYYKWKNVNILKEKNSDI